MDENQQTVDFESNLQDSDEALTTPRSETL